MQILIWPHPMLVVTSKPVTEPLDPALVEEMKKTMIAANGVGLAAIQVGVPQTFFLMDMFGVVQTLVNPVWKPIGTSKILGPEGCLSLPGVNESAERFERVEVTYQTPDLQQKKMATLNGLQARIVQHETEHLQGKIFLDRLDVGAKDRARKILKGRRTWTPT